MSQAKVDKYKKEKKNRGKVAKRKKIKKAVIIVILSMFVGMGIGYPLGKYLYKYTSERQKAEATIKAEMYDYWSDQYWFQNYSYLYGSDEVATDLDATSTDAE